MNNNSASWIVGLVLSIGGIIILFLPWFEATVLFTSVSYDAFDMAFGDPFQEDGFWKNFDDLGRFCPLIFGLLSFLNIIVFYQAKDKKASRFVYVSSILMMLIPVYVMICIDPASGSGWRRAIGSANYIGLVIGFISVIVGYNCCRN
ncbi:MAG: hypothetical protein II855_04800 [Candidatus Methanomethylophilaceae archaeon]|nr:hypothetical protein [Candidatus Methanomethylophilaceae archaeon]